MALKIALVDLNHTTRGVHTNTVPLGLGAIARYLDKTSGHSFNTMLFKDTGKALKVFESWQPDVLGITQYSWNSELNLQVAAWVKEANPKCLVIAGGPNLYLLKAERKAFFKRYPFVDLCVSYDGEIPFAETIKRVMKGEPISDIRKYPGPGIYAYDSSRDDIIEAQQAPPRLDSLDVMGSLYADGFFDKFLDDGFHPFVQTHRGCPFTCAFCHASDRYYSRMLFLSPDIFRRDMEYLGKRFAGRHDVVLYFANTNMSLFKEDFVIAEVIRDIQKKYDWPWNVDFNSGKDPKKLLKMLSIIKFIPVIALQTLTPQVLENIGRKNIPFNEFVFFQREVLKKTGENSATELILSLPGETKESFLLTLREVLNSGVQNVVILTLMNLQGTPLSSPEFAKKYGHVIRHRVVPRQFSHIRGKKILDTEEVVVGTNSMPFDDYIELRGLTFAINSFFNSAELTPLKRLLIESNVDLLTWISGILSNLAQYPDLKSLYDSFIQDTKDELFIDRSALLAFFEKEENFDALSSGKFGDNLVRKYKCVLLARHYQDVLRLAVTEASKLLSERIGEEKSKVLLQDMFEFLSVREVRKIFDDTGFVLEKKLRLQYDIPAWLALDKEGLENFHGSFEYIARFDGNTRTKAKNFAEINKDKELSLQILYRDGNIRYFWPQLEKI